MTAGLRILPPVAVCGVPVTVAVETRVEGQRLAGALFFSGHAEPVALRFGTGGDWRRPDGAPLSEDEVRKLENERPPARRPGV